MKGPIRHEFSPLFNRASGFCDVRVFDATPASGGLPVVILTEPNDNYGPSVTNSIEQIAAQVMARYVAEQDGLEPPFVLIEHYPDRQPRGKGARWHDPFFGETFDQVWFSTWRLRMQRVQGQACLTFGEPDWKRVDRGEVERLIGGPLPWTACTCAIRLRPAEVVT